MGRDGRTGWMHRLIGSAAPRGARPNAAPALRGRLDLADRIACVALSHPEVPGSELRALIGELRTAGYLVLVALREPDQCAPLLDLIAADPAILPIEVAADGPFALWQAAFAETGLAECDPRALLLLSSQLRGPFAARAGSPALRKLLGRVADFSAADVWGLTESWADQYHLSASFLHVGPRALAHPAWGAFWSASRSFAANAAAVQRLETELTQTLLHAGLIAAAAFPYQVLLDTAGQAFAALRTSPPVSDADRARAIHLRRIRTLQANRTPMEPLNFFWQELLDLGAPFVTRDLLGRNPYGIVTAAHCAACVSTGIGADRMADEPDTTASP